MYILYWADTQLSTDDLKFLTRIHYKASSDPTWGEHEIDYILFVQKDVTIVPNPNEVMSHCFVDSQELKDLLAKGNEGEVKITPWFKLICERLLFEWWDKLDRLDSFIDEKNIHRMC